MKKSPTESRVRVIANALEVLALGMFCLGANRVAAQSNVPVEIDSPADGAVLTGVTEVRGTVNSTNFLSASLAFGYDGALESQWFNIVDIPAPVRGERLAMWDTHAVTDGSYILRLRLNGTDGTVQDAVIRVQVRNYTSAPSSTASPTPTALPALRVSTPVVVAATPTAPRVQAETPTPLPANPARITEPDLVAGFARGGLAVLAVFLLWGAVNLRGRLRH